MFQIEENTSTIRLNKEHIELQVKPAPRHFVLLRSPEQQKKSVCWGELVELLKRKLDYCSTVDAERI